MIVDLVAFVNLSDSFVTPQYKWQELPRVYDRGEWRCPSWGMRCRNWADDCTEPGPGFGEWSKHFNVCGRVRVARQAQDKGHSMLCLWAGTYTLSTEL